MNNEIIGHWNLRSKWFDIVNEFFMANPIDSSFIKIFGLFGHERDWLHWVIKADFSRWKYWAIFEVDSFLQSVEFWSYLVIFFSYPIKVATFFASVAKKTRLLSAIEGKWLIAVDEIIDYIYTFVFQCLFYDELKSISFRHIFHNFLFSLHNLFDFFRG